MRTFPSPEAHKRKLAELSNTQLFTESVFPPPPSEMMFEDPMSISLAVVSSLAIAIT